MNECHDYITVTKLILQQSALGLVNIELYDSV